MTTCDIPYFIKKFEAIPERLWCTGEFRLNGRCCVFGHCGLDSHIPIKARPEAGALVLLFCKHSGSVLDTNDDIGTDRNLGQGHEAPRDRILAALRWMQKQEAKP